jgi:5-methylcytosine-specific restriction endonuclease McrA
MTYIPDKLRDLVYQRAAGRCEYCLIYSDDAYKPHEVDHIVAEKHGGKTQQENLCLSCFDCNRHKGSDLASLDPGTADIVLLFHPRRDDWKVHFALVAGVIQPISPQGRATAYLLQFNTPRRVAERGALIKLGRYPR